MSNLEEIAIRAAGHVEDGDTILYPTDTIWGLGCDPTNSMALKKVYELKQRSLQKSIILLFRDVKMIEDTVGKLSEEVLELLNSKKPTTVILDGKNSFPVPVASEDGTIAIRIPQHKFSQLLLDELNGPIVSTSANVSGAPSPVDYQSISKEIKSGVGYICDHMIAQPGGSQASRIVSWKDGAVQVIRP